MQTIERVKGDTWQIDATLYEADEYGEPKQPPSASFPTELSASTFAATLKQTIGGAVIWTANPSDIALINAATGAVEIIVPRTTTLNLNPANILPGLEYLLDLKITTSTGYVFTAFTVQILVTPSVG